MAEGLSEHAGAISESLLGDELFLERINTDSCSLNRHLRLPVDRANRAAAKTVRGQPCRLARPRPSGAPGGQPPDPFDAPHSLRYPLVPPFFLKTNLQRRRWPVKNLFSKARSLAALTLSKKVLDRHPSALAKTIPSMRKKGGSKKRHAAHAAASPPPGKNQHFKINSSLWHGQNGDTSIGVRMGTFLMGLDTP